MILGVLKAGGFFSYLDPNLPKIRNTKILVDIQAGTILTEFKHEQYAHEINKNQAEVLIIGSDNEMTNNDCPTSEILSDDPACLIYTSGTTGTSKGIILAIRQFFQESLEHQRI